MPNNGTRVLITGGVGFLGANYAAHLLNLGFEVAVLDNFSRGQGCRYNADWLRKMQFASNLRLIEADIRDYRLVEEAVRQSDVVVHAAAQTSVPVSVAEPRVDFETNTLGTFNVLESVRKSGEGKVVVFVGTNKVYGATKLKVVEKESRYDYRDELDGVDESMPIDPLEPYGVSKAAAELYAQIYRLRYGLKVADLRFSLLYGPRQWGTEEQGFVAWFCAALLLGMPISIFGDGKQVRDLLHVSDAISAIDSAIQRVNAIAGVPINLGGGKDNSVSLLELLDYLQTISGRKAIMEYRGWREHDVKCFYTDHHRATELLGWAPKLGWRDGVRELYAFISANRDVVRNIHSAK